MTRGDTNEATAARRARRPPMDATYPTRYCDAAGEVTSAIHDDGDTLSMCVRRVEFQGMSFDDSLCPEYERRARGTAGEGCNSVVHRRLRAAVSFQVPEQA